MAKAGKTGKNQAENADNMKESNSKPRKAKTIGIISIKGGVGKTTTVSNLGAILANDFGKKVLVVDANFTAPNLGLHLGIVDPAKSLHDVLGERVPIEKAIISHEYGFDVLPAALVPKQRINPYKLINRLNEIKKNYDIILIDSSPTLNEEIVSTIVASDELLVVTSPDYPTLSCTMRAIQAVKRKNREVIGLVLNKVRGKNFELSIEEIEKNAETPVLAVLKDDVRILEALSLTKPAAIHSPKSDTIIEYKKLAAALVGEEYKGDIFERMKSFISPKTKQDLNRQELFESKNS